MLAFSLLTCRSAVLQRMHLEDPSQLAQMIGTNGIAVQVVEISNRPPVGAELPALGVHGPCFGATPGKVKHPEPNPFDASRLACQTAGICWLALLSFGAACGSNPSGTEDGVRSQETSTRAGTRGTQGSSSPNEARPQGGASTSTSGSRSSGAGGANSSSASGGSAAPLGGGDFGGFAGQSTGAGGRKSFFSSEAYFDGASQFTGLPETRCSVTVTSAEQSPNMATVGIVTFSTDLANLLAAELHFGPKNDYGLVAPVDLREAGYRTLLLGMTQNATYHFRVAVSDGFSVCYGQDGTLETGALSTKALARATTTTRAAPGFIVTSRDGEAVIYNKAGDVVWAFPMWNVLTVQMSWDGKYLFGRDPGPFDLGNGGQFYRVKMDGSDFVTLDAPGGDHHDFTAIPSGIAYLAKTNQGECDRVYEASVDITDGTPIFDTWPIYQHFPDLGTVEGTEICHANRIHYSHEKDLYTVSDRNKDALAFFSRLGTPITSIGTAPTGSWRQHIQAEGAGLGGQWHVQHGHHYYADDKLLVFTNESNDGAQVLHYTIAANRATLDWKYAGAGASNILGDVQHLPNGNFLVTANLSNLMIELGSDGKTEVGRYVLDGPIGPLYGFGYASHRPSLYGTPAPR